MVFFARRYLAPNLGLEMCIARCQRERRERDLGFRLEMLSRIETLMRCHHKRMWLKLGLVKSVSRIWQKVVIKLADMLRGQQVIKFHGRTRRRSP